MSSFSSHYHNATSTTARLMTNLTWDDPLHRRRLVLGDFSAPSSGLLGGGTFGGISWGTQFTLDRHFKFSPTLDVSTIVETAGRAQLYSEGRVIKEWEVLPGQVTFADLGTYAGGTELVLTDVFGREQRLTVPLTGSGQMLREGLQEYSYNLGLNRQNLLENDYQDLTLLGYHRYGMTNYFTVGLNFIAHPQMQAISTAFSSNLNQQLLDGEWAISHAGGTTGYALVVNHTYRYQRFFTHWSWQYRSQKYSPSPYTYAPNQQH